MIVAGTAANGAVPYTASHAAQTGFNVTVPINGTRAGTPYAEQFVIGNLANASRISNSVKLTTTDRIAF